MACYHPQWAWSSLAVNVSGKRSLVFQESMGVPGSLMQIDCGHCLGCRIDKSIEWSIRVCHEMKYHERCCWLTLTYDPAHYPEHGQLVADHLRRFIKALRKHFGKGVRYFACGEYGEQLSRPHFHVCLFGVDFGEDRREVKKRGQFPVFRSELATKLWGRGFVEIGLLTRKSAGYTARYIMKKINGELAETHYQRYDEQTQDMFLLMPEFIRVSTRPGLGYQFFEQYKDTNWYTRDTCILEGKEFPIPKYYDKLMERHDPERMAAVKAKRIAKALERNPLDQTDSRLRVREEVKQAMTSTLSRQL
jgi:hypothetical protein